MLFFGFENFMGKLFCNNGGTLIGNDFKIL